MGIKIIRTKSRRKRKKMEFMQKYMVGCLVIMITLYLLSLGLSFLDKNPVESALTMLVQCSVWLNVGNSATYGVTNCVRAYSANKYGYTETEDIMLDKEDEV